MALFFAGKSRCAVCGRVVEADAGPVLFPAFVTNSKDPLAAFHDAVVHESCLDRHPLGREALRRRDEVIARCAPAARRCVVCGQVITNPDDYFGTGYLGPESSPVGAFNYLHLHRSHFLQWAGADEFRSRLAAYVESDEWNGPSVIFDPLPRFVAKGSPVQDAPRSA